MMGVAPPPSLPVQDAAKPLVSMWVVRGNHTAAQRVRRSGGLRRAGLAEGRPRVGSGTPGQASGIACDLLIVPHLHCIHEVLAPINMQEPRAALQNPNTPNHCLQLASCLLVFLLILLALGSIRGAQNCGQDMA